MKRKHFVVAALAAAALLTSCGEPSATQQTCDQMSELYDAVGNQWLPHITTGVKKPDATQHAEHVAETWAEIAASSEDPELADLMHQLQPVLDTYRDYANQPIGDHPADDAENQAIWQQHTSTISQMCNSA